MHVEMSDAALGPLERELIEIFSMSPETTTTLDEEMLASSPGRHQLEAVLRDLVERGLMTTFQGTFAGVHRPRDDAPEERVFDDDWWEATETGREAANRGGGRASRTLDNARYVNHTVEPGAAASPPDRASRGRRQPRTILKPRA
jgi:hypothetical protein